MAKKLNKPTQTPEGGATKQKDIQQKIGPIILLALTKKGQEQISPEVLLEAKLELLHRCLDPKEVPKKLPEVLSEFEDAFDMFRQTIEATLTMDEYTEALSTFRDILLKDL